MTGENCVSCGMLMERPEDHASSDVTNNFCHFCSTPDGTRQSYEERLEALTHFMMNAQKIEPEDARANAKAQMALLPAWQGHS